MKTQPIVNSFGSIRVERWFNGEHHEEHVRLTDPFGKQHLLSLSLQPEAPNPDSMIEETAKAMEAQYQYIRQRAVERGHLKEDCGCGPGSKSSGNASDSLRAPVTVEVVAKQSSAD